jgi:hypothetical protein
MAVAGSWLAVFPALCAIGILVGVRSLNPARPAPRRLSTQKAPALAATH